jgi:hypothetical protein
MSYRMLRLRVKLVALIMRGCSRAYVLVPRVSEDLEVLPDLLHTYRLALRYQAQSGAVIQAIRNSIEALIFIDLLDIHRLIA